MLNERLILLTEYFSEVSEYVDARLCHWLQGIYALLQTRTSRRLNVGKRRILDPGYLQALHRENVDLTDDRIESLSGSDLVTKSGKRYSVDIVVRDSFISS